MSFWDWLAKLPQGSASFIGTLTGSSLGLFALLIGALFNAYLNRRRDDRLRDQDRSTVASILYAESIGMRRTLIENADHLEQHPPSSSDGFVVPQPSAKLFDSAIANIGLLGPGAIRKVLDAYVLNESYLEQLILAGGRLHGEMPEDRKLVYMPATSAPFVAKLNRTRAGVVDEAIKALDHQARKSGSVDA
ncbi:hypothetical protein GPL21_33170 [Bradyrhizobium pachyrhizi]|uniref:Uncharacterized protein n=1 Tax=Bradyrhizobium pachyrhizi TaxID=280333 RepID=A0A844T4F6_9BRAD|nr:hypothetical protein [Bradyrhizobium pachyrhizi]MVT69941.1 hypothetical protein [Bradyrhizobium pachyrhizi]